MKSLDSKAATPTIWLSKRERIGLVGLAAAAILFGGVVELRSAFVEHRWTDLDVYLRAAWAVRSGADIYSITDPKGLHYHYPPLLAILMVPLADPPAGAAQSWAVPFAASVAIWYVLNLAFVALGGHWLANAIEQTSPDPEVRKQPPRCRRWWALRVVPLLVCAPEIAAALAHGQATLLVLMLLCAMAAAIMLRKPWQAGLWLSGAICLKLIPAFVLLYPIWRRQGRLLAGCGLGLLLGFAIIPALRFGPARTVDYYREWNRVLIQPALFQGGNQSRSEELFQDTASQSFQNVIHNTANLAGTLHRSGAARPSRPSPAASAASWMLGAVLAGTVLMAAGSRRAGSPLDELLFVSALIPIMVVVSPECHLHYFSLLVPLIAALIAARWERQATLDLGPRWLLLFAVNAAINALLHIQRLQVLRELGLGLYVTLLVWLASVEVLWNRRTRVDQDAAIVAAGPTGSAPAPVQ